MQQAAQMARQAQHPKNIEARKDGLANKDREK